MDQKPSYKNSKCGLDAIKWPYFSEFCRELPRLKKLSPSFFRPFMPLGRPVLREKFLSRFAGFQTKLCIYDCTIGSPDSFIRSFDELFNIP